MRSSQMYMHYSKISLFCYLLISVLVSSCVESESGTPSESPGTENVYTFADDVQKIEITPSGDIWALVSDGDILSNIFVKRRDEEQFTKLEGFDSDFNTGTPVSGFAMYDLRYDASTRQMLGLARRVIGGDDIIFKILESEASIEPVFISSDYPDLDLFYFFDVLAFDEDEEALWFAPYNSVSIGPDLYKLDLTTSNISLIDSAYVFTPSIFFSDNRNPIAVSPLSRQIANDEESIKFVEVRNSGLLPIVEINRTLEPFSNEFYDLRSMEITPAKDLYIISTKYPGMSSRDFTLDRYNFLNGQLIISIPFSEGLTDLSIEDFSLKLERDNIDKIWIRNEHIYNKILVVGLDNEMRILDSSNSNFPETSFPEVVADFHPGIDGFPWLAVGNHIVQIKAD